MQKELEQVLTQYLRESGVMENLKQTLRAEIFKIINQEETATVTKSEPSLHQAILNELIREYLVFAGYSNSASLFSEEADLESQGISRDLIEAHMKIQVNRKTPLLLALVFPSDN